MNDMRRCLIGSAAAHGAAVLILFFGILRPGPIRLGTVYGVEYMGNAGGGGGNGLPAPAPRPVPEVAAPPKEAVWSLRKKKTRHITPTHKKEKKPARHEAAERPTHAPATAKMETTGTEGGQGEGIGVGVGTGAGPGTGSGSGGFPYSWYLLSIKTKLWREWSRWAGSSQPHNCVVTFSIGRDGSVSGISLHQSSGDAFYDQMAVRSVNYAAPFPPLPAGYGSGDLDLYVEFKFLAGN